VAPEPPSPSITNITNPLPLTQNLNPGSGVLSMTFQEPCVSLTPDEAPDGSLCGTKKSLHM
jgi:hypothetical protein